jgi:hypothetical protein
MMKRKFIFPIFLAVMPMAIAQQLVPSVPQKTISSYMGLHAFPAKDQTPARQQQDELACYGWAKQDSGFDPLAALMAQEQARGAAKSIQPVAPSAGGAAMKAGVGGAAAGAATGAVVGAIAGDPGRGAAVGAAGGGVLGLARARRAEKAAEQKAQQQQRQQAQQQAQAKSEMQQKLDGFKRGFSACMEAKNYVVK